MEKDIIREEEAKKLVDDFKNKYEMGFMEELIKDNKASFEHNEKKYCVRQLTLGEKDELNNLRVKKFGQLIKDRDILCEKDLIRLYKERGIDVEKVNEEIGKLESEFINAQLKLGEALANKIGDDVLKTYKKELEELEQKINILRMQKITLLECSLENQVINYVYEILTYLSLDVYEDEKWVRAFVKMEDFVNCKDDILINKAARLTMLLHNID